MKIAALFVIASCAACSLQVDPGPPVHPLAPPPPLEIVGPHASDVVYTDADDEAPDVPGIRITLRVDVWDEAVNQVVLLHGGESQDDVVGEDLDGFRAALFKIALAPAQNRLVARAPDLGYEAASTLTAR